MNPSEPRSPLFNLPRELRNIIYENLKGTFSIAQPDADLENLPKVGVHRLIPHFRLFNTQFKYEAEAQAWKKTTLTLEDNPKPWTRIMPEIPPNILTLTTDVEIKLMAVSEVIQVPERGHVTARGRTSPAEISAHQDWISSLKNQLPNLEALRIDIYIRGFRHDKDVQPGHPHPSWLNAALERFVETDGITVLKVYEDRGGVYQLWRTWSCEKGWQKW